MSTLLCGLPSCGEKATSNCASCKTRGYCSKAHQRDDWKDHKVECKRSVKARGTATVLHWLANIQDCTITYLATLMVFSSLVVSYILSLLSSQSKRNERARKEGTRGATVLHTAISNPSVSPFVSPFSLVFKGSMS